MGTEEVCVCFGLVDPMTLDPRHQPVYYVCTLCTYVCDDCACSAVCRAKPLPFHTTDLFFLKVPLSGVKGHATGTRTDWSLYFLVRIQHLSTITAVDMCQLMLTLCVFVCVCGRV